MLSSKSFMKCEMPSARADHPSTAHLAPDSVLTAVPLHVSPGSPEPRKLHEVQSMPETGVQTPAGQNSEGFLAGLWWPWAPARPRVVTLVRIGLEAAMGRKGKS